MPAALKSLFPSMAQHLRAAAAVLALLSCTGASAQADPVLDAREALRRKDGAVLAQLRDRVAAQQHPLASWVDYWELGNRLDRAQQSDLDAFYERWPGSYVEDRLRNDWLLELGRRRDWAHVAREFPRFRMNDDREVTCYALMAEHTGRGEGQPVPPGFRERALQAWLAQRDLDDGCQLLATTLTEARVFTAEDAWRRARLMAEAGRPKAARAAAALAAPALQAQVASALDKPALYLGAGATVASRAHAEAAALALIRVAAGDPDVAANQMSGRWQARLPADLSAWVWGQVARNAAFKLMPEANGHYRSAWAEAERAGITPAWSDDTLAWAARAALRDTATPAPQRWAAVLRAIDHMSPAEQRDPAWRYWRARALRETAAPGAAGDRQLAQALAELGELAGELSFYGKLASEDLGQRFTVPARPQPLNPEERTAAQSHPGLTRALALIGIGLRNEGVREWNFSLRGMGDRALLAAAERACNAEVWDRCINTSDRTRREVDLEQRFPMPFRDEVVAAAREIGLDPAYVYGLIRQESRFIMDARSHVGASGLMQIMPATARWTAKKIGLPYKPDMITDRSINLKLGTSYLKLVLDDFGGSQTMAAAAYNAGPSRPRRWREGALLDPAVWAENIPFNETRDYVKKVLSNATVYAAMLAGQRQPAPAPATVGGVKFVGAAASAALPAASALTLATADAPAPPPPMVLPSLRSRLGASIGPRDAAAAPPDGDLP
ncbi:MAG TPA: transglycosylase SLT domain-containing protein [Burkholderiaceae bacterium]|nr:transglycosylase SLT domain-containing protein [Burkholderiaceae bacterium]